MFQIIFHWLQQTSTGGVQVYKDEEINKPREPIQEVNCLFPPHLQTSGTFRRAAESHITSPSVYHYINVFKKRQSRHISEETSIIDTRCRAERSRLQSWARRLNVWASRWRALNCWHESCGTFWDSIKSMSHLKSSAYKIITRFKRLNHLCLLNIEWSISHGRKRFFSRRRTRLTLYWPPLKKTISSDRVEQEDKLQRVAASQTQKGESLIIESNNEEVWYYQASAIITKTHRRRCDASPSDPARSYSNKLTAPLSQGTDDILKHPHTHTWDLFCTKTLLRLNR